MEGAWIGDHACEGRGRSRFRAAQVNVVFGCAGTPRKLRYRAHADAARGGSLSHADAAVATSLMQAGSRPNRLSPAILSV